MNITEAREISDDLLNGYDAMDRQLERPGRCITALHLLEDAGREDIVNAVYHVVPGLLFFDENGNWIGPVPNENGLT